MLPDSSSGEVLVESLLVADGHIIPHAEKVLLCKLGLAARFYQEESGQ